MRPWQHQQKRMVQKAEAARDGRIYYAFYCGFRDAKKGVSVCPFDKDADIREWNNGVAYWKESQCQE